MLNIFKMAPKRVKLLFPDVQQTVSGTIYIILTDKYSGVLSPFLVINSKMLIPVS